MIEPVKILKEVGVGSYIPGICLKSQNIWQWGCFRLDTIWMQA
jgi:hypothetical protein